MLQHFRQVFILFLLISSALGANENPHQREMDQLVESSNAIKYYPPNRTKDYFASLEEGEIVLKPFKTGPTAKELRREEQAILDEVSMGQAGIQKGNSLEVGGSEADEAIQELLEEVSTLKRPAPIKRPRRRSR